MNKKVVFRAIITILIIVNCIMIFKFSSQQSEQSKKTSGIVVDTIIEINPKTRKLSKEEKEKKKEEIVLPVRKTAHFTAYASLGALIYMLSTTFQGKTWKKILISILLAFLYACSDETHQLFVEGRSGEVRDVLIDSCGAGFGAFAILLIVKIKNKMKNKKIKY